VRWIVVGTIDPTTDPATHPTNGQAHIGVERDAGRKAVGQ
jgi:hypothetical protein